MRRLFAPLLLAHMMALAQSPAAIEAECVRQMISQPLSCQAALDPRQFKADEVMTLIGQGGAVTVPAWKYADIKSRYNPALPSDVAMCHYAASRSDDPHYLAIVQTLWGFGPDAGLRARIADMAREPGWYAGQVMQRHGLALAVGVLVLLAGASVPFLRRRRPERRGRQTSHRRHRLEEQGLVEVTN